MSNLQEAFEKATLAVIAQGCASTGGEANDYLCRYRGEKGTKCWVGHLIPDEHYSPQLEKHSLSEVRNLVPALHNLPMQFLHVGQKMHDSLAGMPDFVARFKDEARHATAVLGLNASFLENTNLG